MTTSKTIEIPRGLVHHGPTDTDGIANLILKMDETAYNDVLELAEKFKDLPVDVVCKKIWDFLRNKVTYSTDEKYQQWVQWPKHFLKYKIGDCKSMSLLTGSILKALGIPYFYRLAKYKDGDYKHIYTIVPINNEEIIIDGVYHLFNAEENYLEKKDIMPETQLYSIGAIDHQLGLMDRAQALLKIMMKRVFIEDKIASSKGRKVKGYNAQLKTLQQIALILNSGLPSKEKVKRLNTFKTQGNKVLIDELIKGIGIKLIPYWDDLTDEQKDEVSESINVDIPNMAGAVLYAFIDDFAAQQLLGPKGIVKRNLMVAEVEKISTLYSLPMDYVMAIMKTRFIELTGMTPRAAVVATIHDGESIEGFGALLAGAVKVAGTAITKVKEVVTKIKPVIDKIKPVVKTVSAIIPFIKPKKDDTKTVQQQQQIINLTMAQVKEYQQNGTFSGDVSNMITKYYTGKLKSAEELNLLNTLKSAGYSIPPYTGFGKEDDSKGGGKSKKWC